MSKIVHRCIKLYAIHAKYNVILLTFVYQIVKKKKLCSIMLELIKFLF